MKYICNHKLVWNSIFREVEQNTYKAHAPKYSMLARRFCPGDKTRKPGPGSYYPELRCHILNFTQSPLSFGTWKFSKKVSWNSKTWPSNSTWISQRKLFQNIPWEFDTRIISHLWSSQLPKNKFTVHECFKIIEIKPKTVVLLKNHLQLQYCRANYLWGRRECLFWN